MNFIFLLIPYLISFLIGFFLLSLFLSKNDNLSFPVKSILGMGMGLGISAAVAFLSLILFDMYSGIFAMALNLMILGVVFYYSLKINGAPKFQAPQLSSLTFFPIILVLLIPFLY